MFSPFSPLFFPFPVQNCPSAHTEGPAAAAAWLALAPGTTLLFPAGASCWSAADCGAPLIFSAAACCGMQLSGRAYSVSCRLPRLSAVNLGIGSSKSL